jgi:putative DNA primase/helicase
LSGETVFAIDDWVCAPLESIARTATERDTDYGRLLTYKSSKGQEKLWAMPMELLCGDGSEVLGQLLRDGLEISYPRRRKILDYIAQTKPLDFKRCATRTGWHSEQVFVLTEEVIGSSDVWFQASSRTADYSRSGTLDGWKKHVAAVARGNLYLVFAISFSLAGPLMERLKLQGIGCHLFGDSTSGKTSVAEAAASVWGHGHAFMQTWNTTSNALEGVCAEHSDTVLVLDEIKEIDGRDLDRVAYSAMNGQGKIRATRIGAMRPPLLWRVALLSTGEYSIRAKLAEIGIVIKAGQELRLVDIPVIGEKVGIFSNLHGAKDGAQFANSLRAAASEYYGHAGPEIVRVILGSDPKVLRKKHAEILELFDTSNAQEIRVARMFATAALAGELAAAHQLVEWQCSSSNDYSDSDSANAAVSLFNRWRQNRETNSMFGSEHSSIMQLISDALEKHTDSRFSDLNQVTCVRRANPTAQIPPPMIRDRLGWFDDSSGERIYLLLPSGLREITKGFDFKRVLSALEVAGALARKGSDTPAIPTRVPDRGIVRLYHIEPQKLNS